MFDDNETLDAALDIDDFNDHHLFGAYFIDLLDSSFESDLEEEIFID